MGNPEPQATLRTRHKKKTTITPPPLKKTTSQENIKINSTYQTKTPEVIAYAR